MPKRWVPLLWGFLLLLLAWWTYNRPGAGWHVYVALFLALLGAASIRFAFQGSDRAISEMTTATPTSTGTRNEFEDAALGPLSGAQDSTLATSPAPFGRLYQNPGTAGSHDLGQLGDSFYRHMSVTKLPSYQEAFEQILSQIDLANHTMWSEGSTNYDKERKSSDDERLVALANTEAEARGLQPEYLAVLTCQYVFADPDERAECRSRWVERVRHREAVDYFPAGGALYRQFFAH